jgi:hypothetical protein
MLRLFYLLVELQNYDVSKAGKITAQTRSELLQLGGIFRAYSHVRTYSKVRTYLLYPSKQLYNPQQLEHFVYIWYGCGMQSMGVWSLNHDITTSLGLSPTPIFLESTPGLQRRNSVRVHPYAYSQHIKVLKHFVYILYGCGMQSTGVWSLNHDIATCSGSALPQFSKNPPLTCTGVTL